MDNRLRAAAEIVIDELKSGRGTPETLDLDATAAMLFRYMRAAQEGAARSNLRLMAKIISGQRQNQTLTADAFLHHAEILAHLRREELILLGTLCRYWQDEARESDNAKRMSLATASAKMELIPSVFANDDEFIGTMAAITRTGLLIPGSAWGTLVCSISPLVHRLNEMAPFEAALGLEAES